MIQCPSRTPQLEPTSSRREAPIVIAVRRHHSKLFQLIKWNTQTNTLQRGKSFRGRLYPLRSDVSFDGRYMVFLAMGAHGEKLNGLCEPPSLTTICNWSNFNGTYFGGGYWTDRSTLMINLPHRSMSKVWVDSPAEWILNATGFESEILMPDQSGDEGVLHPRLERDGSVRATENEWRHAPTPSHPRLHLRFSGYDARRGRIFSFDLPDYPGMLDERVTWACWDALGQLIIARAGVLERWTLEDIKRGVPSSNHNLEQLTPPQAEKHKA